MADELGLGLNPGDPHYRAYVGPPGDYDRIAAMTFGLLTSLGLRQHHKILDIGCGSLRVGRLLIPYLNSERYFGIEPNRWLVEHGITKEIGESQIQIKKPEFLFAVSAEDWIGKHHFDFAIAQSIFSHTGRELLETWLGDASQLLTSCGALVATFLIGEADSLERNWVYPGCVKYTVKTMEAGAKRYGFSFQVLDWRHPRQTWVLFANPGFDSSWFQQRPLCWNTFMDFGPGHA